MAALRSGSNRVYEAIVVGAGGAHGSATLYHLAKRLGGQVLGLEAQPAAPHNQGSSHGLTRIIRLSYFEHPSYVPLLRESYRLWRELEKESGQSLLTMTGCINTSPPGCKVGPGLTETSCFDGALLAAQEHGLEHEVLNGDQVSQRFPAYKLPANFQALYEKEGGVLVPERCITAHLDLAQKHGAELVCGARVQRWKVAPGGSSSGSGSGGGGGGDGSARQPGLVHVETSAGSFTGKRLVLAAGGWMGQLVPELQPLLTVERQVIAWFDVAPEQRAAFGPDAMPACLLQDEQGYYYSFPLDEHGFKIGKFHHLGQVTTADAVDRSVTAADEEVLRDAVRRFFPGANGQLKLAAACTFTNTPDGHFLLDKHPCHSQVVLASACSGHGFKFASVVGSVLADLALEGNTAHDISLHRLALRRPKHAKAMQAFAQNYGGGQ